MSLPPSDVQVSPDAAIETIALGCTQALLGLVLGGATVLVLAGADPFKVMGFTIPAGVDGAQAMAAFTRWKGSVRVVAGQFAMDLIPLLVSGLCGVSVHKCRPVSVLAAPVRMIGVAFLLAVVSSFGARAIEKALSTGESSDVGAPLAALSFQALCILLAAPLSSIVTRRRSPCHGRGTPRRV